MPPGDYAHRMLRIIPIAALMLMASSCFTVVHEYQGAREVTPGTVLSKPTTNVGKVAGTRKATFLFWGLVDLQNASGPDLAESLAVSSFGEDFDGLTHVRVNEEQTTVDVILEIITLGIFSRLTIETEAEVRTFAGGDA